MTTAYGRPPLLVLTFCAILPVVKGVDTGCIVIDPMGGWGTRMAYPDTLQGMTTLRVQHSFQGVSGTPEDQYVNVFHFIGIDVSPASLALLALDVKGFYSIGPTGGTGSIADKMASSSDSPGARVKVYDLSDPKPRAPLYDETYTPSSHGSAAENLPDEVAICLSYSALGASGSPIARRRGRLYLGPWSSDILTGGAQNYSVPNLSARQDITKAAKELASRAIGHGYQWAVYSPTDNLALPIVTVWVDNAWDTQRRRGNQPTSRVTLGVSAP